jgi:hypothetical protein
VQFELPDEFVSVRFCHCTTCQKLSGGIGTANARVRTDAIRLLAGEELVRTYQPDEGTAKTFCSVCGANLFGGGWPQLERPPDRDRLAARGSAGLAPVRPFAAAVGDASRRRPRALRNRAIVEPGRS